MSGYYLGAYVYFPPDQSAHVGAVTDIVREVLAATGMTPTHVMAMKPNSRYVERPFTPELFESYAADETKKGIKVWGETRDQQMRLSLKGELRGRPELSQSSVAPQTISLELQVGEDGGANEATAAAAAELMLRLGAARLPVVSGGAQPFPTKDEALFEYLPMTRDGGALPHVLARWSGDHQRRAQLAHKPRRLYWRTLLGPAMAAKMGGAAAARAAGADQVEEINGALLIHAGALPSSALGKWGEERRALRQWIWTHSIQNPVDAVE